MKWISEYDPIEEHDLNIDIDRLYMDYIRFTKKHEHVTDDARNIDFNAVCVNRIPGDPNSVTGGNVRGKYWTYPTDEDKEEEKTEAIVDKAVRVFEAQEDYKPTEEQKKLAETEDTSEMETIKDVLRKEEAEKEEKKEKSLDEKLADIEKVISSFGSSQDLGSPAKSPFTDRNFQLNKPIDFQTQVAKNYVAPYLQQPTSQGDRIALLFESLKKQNLI